MGMSIDELRDYVEEQRSLNNIPYHVYSTLIDELDLMADTMRKYQKIEQIYNKYYCTMVSMARITQVIKGDKKDGNDNNNANE